MLSTTLRRVLVASGLVVATSGFMTSAAFAGDTATVNLSGTVASTLALSSTATAAASALNLNVSQTGTVVKVADLQMGTNNFGGLTLKLSANSGSLTRVNSTPIPFTVATVSGDGTTPPVVGDYKDTAADTLIGTTAPSAITTPYSLFIKYSTSALQEASVATPYTGAISLVVTDN